MKKYLFLSLIVIIFFEYCEGQAYWIFQEAEEYYHGIGGRTQSYDKAFWLYKKAASMGSVASLRMIGLCYHNGYGVIPSKRKSFIYMKKAADCWDTTAMMILSSYYLEGEGCKKSWKKCFRYAFKAANQGSESAISFLQQFSCYIRTEIIWKDDYTPQFPDRMRTKKNVILHP